jgi:hypothetical protein
MKIMVRVTIAALSFANIGPAIAGDGGGFTQPPGVIAQAQHRTPPPRRGEAERPALRPAFFV